MKRRTKVKIQKMIQYTYLLVFLITGISICGDVELDFGTPKNIFILFIVSGLLNVSKIIYCSIKYPNAKYIWH